MINSDGWGDIKIALSILNGELGDIDQFTKIMKNISEATGENERRDYMQKLSQIKANGNMDQMKSFYEATFNSLYLSTDIPLKTMFDEKKFSDILITRMLANSNNIEIKKKQVRRKIERLISDISSALIRQDLLIHKILRRDRSFVNDDLYQIEHVIKGALKQADSVLIFPPPEYHIFHENVYLLIETWKDVVGLLKRYYGDSLETLGLISSTNDRKAKQQIETLEQHKEMLITLHDHLEHLHELKNTIDIFLNYLMNLNSEDQKLKFLELDDRYSEYRRNLLKVQETQKKLEAYDDKSRLLHFSFSTFLIIFLPCSFIALVAYFFF